MTYYEQNPGKYKKTQNRAASERPRFRSTLAEAGYHTLLVDFDSQANLSKGLGVSEPAKDENTICQPMWADMRDREMMEETKRDFGEAVKVFQTVIPRTSQFVNRKTRG